MRFTALVILALSLIGAVRGVDAQKTPESFIVENPIAALTAVEQWRTESLEHSARVVLVREISCLRSIERLLVSLDTGQRFVMDKERVPSQGLERMKVTEDRSGWWVQMTRNSELRLKTRVPWDFARLAEMMHRHRDEEWGVELSLSASGLPAFEMRSTNTETGFEHRFLAQADQDGLTGRLVEKMPPEAQRGVGFLRSMLDSDQGQGSGFVSFQLLVDFLAGALERQGDSSLTTPYTAQEWEMVDDGTHFISKTTRLEGEALVAEIQTFESIADPEDPLAGQHVSAEDCRP